MFINKLYFVVRDIGNELNQLCVENAFQKLIKARELILIWPLSRMEALYFMNRHTLHVPLLFLQG